MKKLFFLALMLSAYFGFSQKVVEIYNFSSFDIRLDMIVSKDGFGSGGFPWCASVVPVPIVTLGYGDDYIMENTTDQFRFPYNSSVSSPVITNWRWVYPPDPSGNSSWVNIPSSVAWVIGANQVFDYLHFSVLNGAFIIDNDYVGENGFWGSDYITSPNGWTAMYYSSIPDPVNSPNYILYTIVFF